MIAQAEQLLQRGSSVTSSLLPAIFAIFGQWHLTEAQLDALEHAFRFDDRTAVSFLPLDLVFTGLGQFLIHLGDEETGELVFVEVIGESRERLLNYRLPKGVGIARRCT